MLHFSKAHGCMLGQIAGDSLGSLVEFQTVKAITMRYGDDGPRELADGGTFNTLAGQPTDDSELAISLARSMATALGWHEATVISAYIAWRDSAPFDCGMTIAASIETLRRGARPTTASEANGALMRCSPIGIRYAAQPHRAADIAEADAMLTHPSPVCVACNRAYAAAMAALVGGGTIAEAFNVAIDVVPNGEPYRAVIDALLYARNGRMPTNYQEHMGHVLIAFQNAFAWLATGHPLEHAVISTVRKGGDTDTNGAIVGALLGAAQGEWAIPVQWRAAVQSCRPGVGVAPHPRPRYLWPDDCLELAEYLLIDSQMRPRKLGRAE